MPSLSSSSTPIVVDVGSYSSRIGWAGFDQPKIIELSQVAFQSNEIGKSSDSLGQWPLRFNTKRKDCHVRGLGGDSTVLSSILELGLYSGDFSSSLMAESNFNRYDHPVFFNMPESISLAKHMMECLFEFCEVPLLFGANSASLASFACGITDSILLDYGAKSTRVSLIKEGSSFFFHESDAIGGDSLDLAILKELESQCDSVPTYYQSRPGGGVTSSFYNRSVSLVIQDLKHSVCRVSMTPHSLSSSLSSSRTTRHQHLQQQGSLKPLRFKLPDNSEVDISNICEAVPELLFKDTTLMEILKKINIEESVSVPFIIVGGTSQLPGLHTRICTDLGLNPTTGRSCVVPHQFHQQHVPWIGGSILASMSSMSDLWISSSDFLEQGIDRCINKCCK